MREYPHGLDQELLPEDIETAQESIDDFEQTQAESPDDENPLLLQFLGKAQYAMACYKYALGESPAAVREIMAMAFQNLFSSFKMEVVLDVYEFINLLSLAVVLGEDKSAAELAEATRDRYTDEGVAAEETPFSVAQIMSAFVKRDAAVVTRAFAANNPETVETKNIYRYDRLLYFPLLQLLNAVYQRDSDKLAEAWRTRNSEFVRFWRRGDKNDPDVLIDLPGLAVAVFAKQRAVPFSDSSVYRPIELSKEGR